MNDDLAKAVRQAMTAVRAGQPQTATAIVQEALGLGRRQSDVEPAGARAPRPGAVHDGAAAARSSVPRVVAGEPKRGPWSGAAQPLGGRLTQPLGTVVEKLKSLRRAPNRKAPGSVPATPAGARFLWRTYAGPAGRREYRLYVPAARQRSGLLIMLHGCTQDPDDFALGTDMNRLAEAHGLVVAYPQQTRRANVAACWNWFDPAHQRRGAGEPAIIAGLTLALREEFAVGAGRVFVAGLSAGGAMAAVLAATYPELYAAAGIHSGLAYGAASDVMSALGAMKDGRGARAASAPTQAGAGAPRLIVFHGTADATVAPSNADAILADFEAALPKTRRHTERVVGAGQRHGYVVHRVEHAGDPVGEFWTIEGMSHAWSGGSSAGTYTDPAGPDASAEMVRFFLRA